MTAYSFGNKWMGIIALKDPPSAVPEPLHKMALRLRREAKSRHIKLSDSFEVPLPRVVVLLGQIRHRHALREEWTCVRECQDVEQQLRVKGKADLRRWLRRELVQEIRLSKSTKASGKPSLISTKIDTGQSGSERQRHASSQGIETGWVDSIPLAPLSPLLPQLSAELSNWLRTLHIELDDNAEVWLRWATLHTSYMHEFIRDDTLLGVEVLNMLNRLGQAWLSVALLDYTRASDGEFASSDAVSGVVRNISDVLSSLGSWVSEMNCAQLGKSEQTAVANGKKTRALPTVGAQIIGALCLAAGSYQPAVALIEGLSITFSSNVDWRTLLQKALKREPFYEVERAGPDHAAVFTATVTEDHRMASGVGGSRKEAIRRAAETFMRKYFPALVPQGQGMVVVPPPQPYPRPSRSHAHAVRSVMEAFGVRHEGFICQSLTHSSWAYENKATIATARQRDYGVLAAEGAVILPALVYHQHLISTLGRSLQVPEDTARMPSITEDTVGLLFDAFSLGNGVLLGRGEGLKPKIVADVAQAVIGAVWRETPGLLAKRQPSPLHSWMMSVGNELDPATQVDRYCSSLGLGYEVTFSGRGPDHAREQQATYTFTIVGSPKWSGPWLSSKTKAKKAAAAQIVELIIVQGTTPPDDLEPHEARLLAVFYMAEITAADPCGVDPSREIAARRLAVDALAAGSLTEFAAWARGRERFTWPEGAVAERLQRYYTNILIQNRRNVLTIWTKPHLHIATLLADRPVPSTLSSWDTLHAPPLSILAEMVSAAISEVHSLALVLDGWSAAAESPHLINHSGLENISVIPGAASATNILLKHAAAVSNAVSARLEVTAKPDGQSSVELAIRIPSVDVATTLELALSAFTALIPGTQWRPTDNAVVVVLPADYGFKNVITRAGYAALHDALADPWLSEFASCLNQTLENGSGRE